MRGKQHTYALLAERIPNGKPLEREAALAELTRRYYTSRGPATVNDFARWSSLTTAQAREGIALVAHELESDVIDGTTYWFDPPLPRASASAKPRVDLVQGYDEIIMSYSESRDASLGPVDSRLLHAVLLDGRMIGKWKPVAGRNSVVLKTVLNRTLNRAEKKALATAVALTTAWMSGK